MPRRNEKPTHIGFKSQEGDRGLQEGDRSLGWDGGAGDILLRGGVRDRKSTRLNSSHSQISYAVFCLKIKIQGDYDKPQATAKSIDDSATMHSGDMVVFPCDIHIRFMTGCKSLLIITI